MDPTAITKELIAGGLRGLLLRVFPNGNENRLRGRYKDNNFTIILFPGESYSLSMQYNNPEITRALTNYIEKNEETKAKRFRYRNNDSGLIVIDWEIKVPRARRESLISMNRRREISELVELV